MTEYIPLHPNRLEMLRREAHLLAEKFHETYERLAPRHSYKTREASAVPWSDVPKANKDLMVDVCWELIRSGQIRYVTCDDGCYCLRKDCPMRCQFCESPEPANEGGYCCEAQTERMRKILDERKS